MSKNPNSPSTGHASNPSAIPAPIQPPPLLRAGKYLCLVLLVIVLPLTLVDSFGLGRPWFCKAVCPAGTLEAGIPMLLLMPELTRSSRPSRPRTRVALRPRLSR